VEFERTPSGLLCISPTVLNELEKYRQHNRSAPEAGGIILGRIFPTRGNVEVDAVTVPNSQDHGSRFRFTRARKPAQREIERAWVNSQGIQNYLGEWHTHPEDDPRPSSVDVDNWIRLARIAEFEQDALFFLIVGRVTIRAWEVKRGGGEARPLEQRTSL
jgi:integrative and conjugative element protein (TIGR02256 family)